MCLFGDKIGWKKNFREKIGMKTFLECVWLSRFFFFFFLDITSSFPFFFFLFLLIYWVGIIQCMLLIYIFAFLFFFFFFFGLDLIFFWTWFLFFNKFRWLLIIFGCLSLFCFNLTSYFNKNIWVNLYKLTFFIPPLFNSQPNKNEGN